MQMAVLTSMSRITARGDFWLSRADDCEMAGVCAINEIALSQVAIYAGGKIILPP